MLKKDDIFRWTPESGSLEGVELICKVIETARLYDVATLELVDRVFIEYNCGGYTGEMILPLNAKYEIIKQDK